MLLLGGGTMHEMVNEKTFAYLQIEEGTPYGKGTYIPLDENSFIVGRSTNSFSADISFENLLISRNHCCLKYCNGEWNISDLGSKHGTSVNEQPIAAHKGYMLKSGDKVVLASGIVVFRFVISLEFDKTLDFDRTQSMKIKDALAFDSHVEIDFARMNLLVDNQVISLSVKEWLLLESLYRQRGKLVSYEEIKKAVWSERYMTDNDFSVVGFDEVNMVIYRLRRKFRNYSKKIKTIRGRGCILDL